MYITNVYGDIVECFLIMSIENNLFQSWNICKSKSNVYSNCKLNDQFCKTGESVLYYDRPKKLCDLILIKEILFDVVYGTKYLHSTRMTSNSSKITFSEVDKEKTPTILISNRETNMLHLTKLNTIAKCGKFLFATNFPDILLSTQVIPIAATSMTPTDVKLTTYLNSKLAYLYHNHLATIEVIYIDLLNGECKLRKEILKTK